MTTIANTFRQKKGGASDQLEVKSSKSKTSSAQAGPSGGARNFTEAEEQVLRQFDLAYKYGPCVGMTRKDRWERASKFGLDPPADVMQILSRVEGEESPQNKNLWTGRV